MSPGCAGFLFRSTMVLMVTGLVTACGHEPVRRLSGAGSHSQASLPASSHRRDLQKANRQPFRPCGRSVCCIGTVVRPATVLIAADSYNMPKLKPAREFRGRLLISGGKCCQSQRTIWKSVICCSSELMAMFRTSGCTLAGVDSCMSRRAAEKLRSPSLIRPTTETLSSAVDVHGDRDVA